VSITQGNYMNVGKGDTSNMVPTWQKELQNKQYGPGANMPNPYQLEKNQNDFYNNHFGGDKNDKKRDLDSNYG
jgi:hypothetical protein